MRTLHIGLFLVASIGPLSAQLGYSTASVGMNRANGIATPDQVVIEEYINYHKHNIPLPMAEEEVALSMNYRAVDATHAVVQVGLATGPQAGRTKAPPVNIALVIDRSGSMSSDDKLVKVKYALRHFMRGLRPEDVLSIITFDSEAQVFLKATPVGEIKDLDGVVNPISCGSSTNLNAGMELGYKEVRTHYKAGRTNKVILLTDGIANVGVTDPERIVANSVAFNAEGIDIATIGVGSDVNFNLLQQIAEKGRGAQHFVGTGSEDIAKVFAAELESLLYTVGQGAELELEYPEGIKVTKVLGYTPSYSDRRITIPLKNLSSGLTQVVLLEVELTEKKTAPVITARLEYTSVGAQSKRSITSEVRVDPSLEHDSEEVRKNYCIGRMAGGLKEAAGHVAAGRSGEGFKVLTASLEELDHSYPEHSDPDLLRVRAILEKNRIMLAPHRLPDYLGQMP